MADPVSDNVAMIMRVVERLAPLKDRLMFLGGVVTELFITSLAASPPWQTKDVDIEVVNLGEYSKTAQNPHLEFSVIYGGRSDNSERPAELSHLYVLPNGFLLSRIQAPGASPGTAGTNAIPSSMPPRHPCDLR